jgi:carbon-monoxide dehydrogenase large subunit
MTNDPRLVGRDVPRQESPARLRGEGLFTADVPLPHALILHILRSPLAAAQFAAPDIGAALASPGVHGVHIGADVAGLGALTVNPVLPMSRRPDFPLLSQGVVHAVGQPIAAILATTADRGADAAELIDIDFDDGPDLDDTPVAQNHWQSGDTKAAFAAAKHIVTATMTHPVLAPCALEPRCISVQYHNDTGNLTIWHSTQTPHRTQSSLAEILGIDAARLRVIAPEVGGAFGMKGSIYPEEVLAVWAALKHRRNVRWTATRSEEFLSATHGRGLHSRGRLALDATGRFLALEAQIEAPLGHWLPGSALIPAWNAARVLPCGYDIDAVDIATIARLTQRPAMGIYRGAGRPEANALMERLVEKAARATGQDILHIREMNLLKPDQLPHDTATGNRLDSGNYAKALALLRSAGGYEQAIARRDAQQSAGTLAGVGIGFYVEPSGEGWESARVTLHSDGTADIASGSSSQGQSRATAFAQIAADALALPLAAITVRFGDTGTCPEGIGALASRSSPIGGSAVLAACRAAKARQDAGESGEITVDIRYENKGQAWGYGVFMAELTVDADTGAIALGRLTCIDDTGVIINPSLVKDQLTGGAAQGLGEALMEQIIFDEDGQLLTGSFMDYALPRASDMPPLDIHSLQTPSPFNLLGAKGVGEAGTIGAPIAILNAALDALAPVGVTNLAMPLTPWRVWQATNDAKQDNRS